MNALDRHLIERLSRGPCSVEEVAGQLGLEPSEIVRHLKQIAPLGFPVRWQRSQAHFEHHDPLESTSPSDCLHQHVPVLTSTQDWLRSFVPRPDRLIAITADFQHQGRGRFQKRWFSGFAKHILLSISFPHIKTSLPISLLLSFALHQWLTHQLHVEGLHIKWPNDLWVHDAKLCGILCETHPDQAHWMIGIGLNVHQDPYAQKQVSQSFTTLEEHLRIPLTRQTLLHQLIQIITTLAFDAGQLQQLTDQCHEHFPACDYFLNKRVHVSQHGRLIEGFGRGINLNGDYLIESSDRQLHPIHTGSIRADRRTHP